MRNTIFGWILSLAGIGLSIGGAVYHQSRNKDKPQIAPSEKAPLVAAGCPVCGPCAQDTLLAAKTPPLEKGRSSKKTLNDFPSGMKAGSPGAHPDMADATEVQNAPSKDKVPLDMAPGNSMAEQPAMGAVPETVEAAKPAVPVAKKKAVMVYFRKGSTRLETEYYEDIKVLLKGREDFQFRIDVRTGDRDSRGDNRSLARKRGRTLRDLLEKAGIPKKNIAYYVYPANPKKPGNHKTRSWRRTRVTATPREK